MKLFQKYNLSVIMLLISTLLLQSCQVYYSAPASTTRAVKSKEKVKILTNNETYKFDKLELKDEQLIGITKSNSATAKQFKNQVILDSIKSKYVKIALEEELIDEIYLINKGRSTSSTILVIGLGAVIVTPIIIAVSNDEN